MFKQVCLPLLLLFPMLASAETISTKNRMHHGFYYRWYTWRWVPYNMLGYNYYYRYSLPYRAPLGFDYERPERLSIRIPARRYYYRDFYDREGFLPEDPFRERRNERLCGTTGGCANE